MLNHDICKQCFLQTMVDNDKQSEMFEKHWELGEIPCFYSDTGAVEMIDVKGDLPKDCHFNLEQVMSQC